jgi:hypothetical protein
LAKLPFGFAFWQDRIGRMPMRLALTIVFVTALMWSGAAVAQVSMAEAHARVAYVDATRGDTTWDCVGVQDDANRIRTQQYFIFRIGTDWRVTGQHEAKIAIGGRIYSTVATIGGYAFNDAQRGVGIVIDRFEPTQIDTLPPPLSFDREISFVLSITPAINGRDQYRITGTAHSPSSSVDLRCQVFDGTLLQ